MDKTIGLLMVFWVVVPCSARTFTVDDNGPADFRSIQDAINASWHGDTIVVRPGTYREQVAFNGRRIVVRSENPDDSAIVQATVIFAPGGVSALFDFAEGSESVLTGLTITGGRIVCMGTSPTLSKNIIRDCTGAGITGQGSAAPTVVGNLILSNALEGIHSCGGLIQGNTISGNNAGIAFCDGPILDNWISDNRGAGGIDSCNGRIAGNRIVANSVDTYGGGLYGCNGEIHNNIFAGNRAGQEGGGLYDCAGPIFNNTIVGNRAGEAGGALSRCPGETYNNIIASNEAPLGAGLHGPCTNTYNIFWSNQGGNFGGGAAPGLNDTVSDPLFASTGQWNSNGTANPNDDTWVDGDYHPRSQAGRWNVETRRWVTDNATGRGVDAGKPSANWTAEAWPHGGRINIGAYGGTPEASMSLSDLGRLTDLNHDEQVGPRDLKQLTEKWLSPQAPLAEDLSRDGTVDLRDFAILAREWGVGPAGATPPIPSPMTWMVPPHPTGPYSMAMTATPATSTDGTGVEYYFEDVFHPEFNSGWLFFGPGQEPRWEDTGLQSETLYWYRVKARNRGNRLETEWSERFGETTPREDSIAPTPNPITWQTEPHALSTGMIRMVASTAVDESGVEYQFECISQPAYSSGWQDSPAYEVGPVPKGHYTFRVRARDKSARLNATSWSTEVTADLKPPTPDPMRWAFEPREVNIGGGTFNYHATMTAVQANDELADVEYFFECTTNPVFSSGWQASAEYTVKIGRQGQRLRFRVKARDTSPAHNETGRSTEAQAL